MLIKYEINEVHETKFYILFLLKLSILQYKWFTIE